MFHAADPLLGSLLFWAFATVAVLCSLGLLIARHPLTGAINLIGVMLSISGLYALMNSPFLAVLQVLVYAGAIMVLVVFVIMVLNQAKDHKVPYLDWRSLLALPLPLLLALLLVQVLSAGHVQPETLSQDFSVEDPALIEMPIANSAMLGVTFRAHGPPKGMDYRWDFGDSSGTNGREVVHVFPKAGNYTVRMNMGKSPPPIPVLVDSAKPGRVKVPLRPHPMLKGSGKPMAQIKPPPIDHSADRSTVIHLRVRDVVRADVATVAVRMFDTTPGGPGYYLLFEIIGVLLLAAVVSAVVLAKRSLMSAPEESAPGAIGTDADHDQGHH